MTGHPIPKPLNIKKQSLTLPNGRKKIAHSRQRGENTSARLPRHLSKVRGFALKLRRFMDAYPHTSRHFTLVVRLFTSYVQTDEILSTEPQLCVATRKLYEASPVRRLSVWSRVQVTIYNGRTNMWAIGKAMVTAARGPRNLRGVACALPASSIGICSYLEDLLLDVRWEYR
ncbi:hypothetical protein EVAR_56962_1 [Eumeta japonica]|uniref:Uncharacterized protein n=1 Tax=Eumeta variegata TaxID=151549 RepID=A0A4C1YM04_EUMVA|nr:hypothetical protein EVAR_56962_1 [Eumeta japonica]